MEIWPSLLGGVNMYPNAYNPKTGNLYLAATNGGMKYGFEDIKVISNVRHFGAYQEFIWGNEVAARRECQERQAGVEKRRKQAGLRRRHADHGRQPGVLRHAGRRVPRGRTPPPAKCSTR